MWASHERLDNLRLISETLAGRSLPYFTQRLGDAIRKFPEDVRREFGKVIFDLQKGEKLSMPLSRLMSSLAAGVEELRVKDRSGAYRVFYYTRLADQS